MTRALACADAVRRLWDFIDDDLEAPDQVALEAHLALCLRCCGELAFARELRHLLRTKSAEDVPDAVQERLERVIDDLDGSAETGSIP
jgi:anti-sigma factor (TIGR02949 family)